MTRKLGDKFCQGFTLIELMIAVAIVAILAAVAYPSYQEQVRKSRRTDVQAALLENAQFMERFYTNNSRYTDAGGNYPALPITVAPREGGTPQYDIATSGAAAAQTYTLRATPRAGSLMANDGFFQIDNVGRKGWDKNNDGAIGAGETDWHK